MIRVRILSTLFSIASLCLIGGCGREASSTLRQGQLSIYDFPLYLTGGVPGRVWRIDKDKKRTLLAEGLKDPRGIVTDRFQNVYVAEYGAGRILKFAPGQTTYEVLSEQLQSPSVLATDSFGEVYVAQDGAMNIIRLSDTKIFGAYTSPATALTFGVDDIPIIGLFNENKVSWSWSNSGPEVAIANPNNASIDGTGRVYIAEADSLNGQILRYHQRDPGDGVVVADSLLGPTGVAVDLIGNIFIVEQGANRIVLVTDDGRKFEWLTDVEDGQYLAFTQY